MKSYRGLWWTFGGCAVLVLSVLTWITWTVLGLERDGERARAEAEHQESIRLALWRMEIRLAPLLVEEVARPYFQYRSYYPQKRAYSRMLDPLEPGEVLTPSPLLGPGSETIRLHFQIDPSGEVSSPQVPTGAQRRLALDSRLTEEDLTARERLLDDLRRRLHPGEILARIQEAEAEVARRLEPAPVPSDVPESTRKSEAEFQKRAQSNFCRLPPGTVSWDPTEGSSVVSGPLIPLWIAGANPDDRDIAFVRRLSVRGEEYVQGFVADWPRVRDDLLVEARDLFPAARLVPLSEDDAPVSSAGMLASLPAVLEVDAPTVAHGDAASPARITLALTWLAALVALAAVGITLRSSVAFAERRRRFVSAVTHELRTPLTTFQMYSEMLAEGMVTEEGRRREYLATLQEESGRLKNIVESVLSYARVEEGRLSPAPERWTVGELLDRVRPPLQRRAEFSGGSVAIQQAPETDGHIHVDADVVGQILLNLVDNACKYGAGEGAPAVHLRAAARGGRLLLDVQDGGRGVRPGWERTIFRPFERGAHEETHDRPGVGLGLALARDLARSIGGELTLESGPGEGACFRLSLPGLLPRTEPLRHRRPEPGR